MLNIDQVTQDIEQWIQNFVEVPHPALGGFPPCPYARSARLKRSYAVYIGADPYYDLKNRARYGMGNKEVIVYAYDPVEWPHELFASSLDQANREFLLAADILVLEDHPADAEIVKLPSVSSISISSFENPATANSRTYEFFSVFLILYGG